MSLAPSNKPTPDLSPPSATNSSRENRGYVEAKDRLYNLQSNAAVLEQWKKERRENKQANLIDIMRFHLGVVQADVNKLAVVHVAGTKGKCSTCAMVESILRAHGLRTGLFTSPHLVEPRERIRIDGVPLSEDRFARAFWTIHDQLADGVTDEHPSLPPFFRFLTVMGFRVFLDEAVDVAIVEVGVGGRSDATNVVDTPVVCGITTLDFDHTEVLGNTIEEIAFEKAGIAKTGAPLFSVPQPETALRVIRETADARKVTSFEVVDELATLNLANDQLGSLPLGLEGAHQRQNAALAVRLCDAFLESRASQLNVEFASSVPNKTLPPIYSKGLETVEWPGRSQTVVVRSHSRETRFYLDGAHTPQSVGACARWFKRVSQLDEFQVPLLGKEQVASQPNGRQLVEVHHQPGLSLDAARRSHTVGDSTRPYRVLFFHCTHGRDPRLLLAPLSFDGKVLTEFFDHVVFFTVHARRDEPGARRASEWLAAQSDIATVEATDSPLVGELEARAAWVDLHRATTDKSKHAKLDVAPSVEQAVELVAAEHSRPIHILVTGSLYLVGASLDLLEYPVVSRAAAPHV